MKVPYNWLKDYAEVNVDPHTLGDKLTLSGSALEEVIIQGDNIKNVVTGKITKIEKHPDADRLNICQVNIGADEEIQIVTAATNMKEQDIVPVALHKSILADGTEIKKGKMRGVVSNGMFCSEEELGIAGDEPVHGLIILPADAPLGMDIKEYLGLNKAILDFEITSNRPDCLSIIGMARETAATLGTSYKMPNFNYEVKSSKNINDELKVEVRDELCRRYMAKGVKNVKVEPSPSWMQERLLEAGVRPINNIVDITNFVMLELGQPMHAFDASKVSQPVQVRLANNGEELVLLDGTTAKLQPNTLVIADQTGPLAMAGIFGGQASGVDAETTKDVILEAAFFAPLAIAGRARQYGLHTDSSHRFERGVDFTLQRHAMERATALLLDICGGEAGEICEVVSEQYLPKVNEVTLRREKLDSLLGHHIETETVTEIFERLGFAVKYANDVWTVTSASWRFDIEIEEDLIEEVFGDIEDEYDDYDKEIEVVKEDEYIVDGSARLDDISDLVGVNMESQEFDSIGGLIIGELGRFPENKEEVNIGNIRFVVEEVDKNRIKKVRIYT